MSDLTQSRHKQQPAWQAGQAPAQALLVLRAFNRRFRLIQMFTPALSIRLATGFLIEGKAGVVRRCRLRRATKRGSEPSTHVPECRYRECR